MHDIMQTPRRESLAFDERRLQLRLPKPVMPVPLPELPSPAFVYVHQHDQGQFVEREHDAEINHYVHRRRNSLDSWKPIITEADIRLRKDVVRKWIRQAHDTFCACGCEVSTDQKLHNEAPKRPRDKAPEPKPAPMKFKSLDDLAADPDEEPEYQQSTGRSLWSYFHRTGTLLRSNSLTDLFATAMGSKKHWYRKSGLRGSLASLGGSMPQLAVLNWNTSADSLPVVENMQLPPEFKVSNVKLDPKAYSPPPRRRSVVTVRFDLGKNKVDDTYATEEYDRDGRVAKVTSDEMCEIRKEMAKFKLIEMEVSSFSRHNTHIFNDFQCGLTKTKMRSNRRLPNVA